MLEGHGESSIAPPYPKQGYYNENNNNGQNNSHDFFLFSMQLCCVAALYINPASHDPGKKKRTNGPVNAHLSQLHIPINMFEYYGI